MTKIGTTSLDVFPLCLGGNVFGWTADEKQSFAMLDAYTAAGGNFIDTADVYSAWAPGNSGGESETFLGRWMTERRNRNRMVIATKVGMFPGLGGLSAKTIRVAAESSLRRLRTDHIDLYYAHKDDAATPLEETLRAFDALVREEKVRHIATSNYTEARLSEALAVSSRPRLSALSGRALTGRHLAISFDPKDRVSSRVQGAGRITGMIHRSKNEKAFRTDCSGAARSG